MISGNIKHIIRFILLILVQVLIVNELDLGKFIHPQVYLLFLLLLPTDMSHWASLLVGFFTGVTIDAFSDTMGIHTAAATLMMYLRYFILQNSIERKNDEASHDLTIKRVGWRYYLTHVTTLVVIHHIVLFFLSAFSGALFFRTLGTIILSSLFTIGLIVILQLTFIKAAEQR